VYLLSKQLFDVVVALILLVLLSPVFLVLSIWIKLDSKGPVMFRQRRIGQHQKEFMLVKFRTMRDDTPNEVPTHLMKQASHYITKSGRFLRRTSLDELPQLIHVLKGEMSLVGPRPALYNQADLITLRESYGVHKMKPGITGYAQVRGRDELLIEEKAKLDAYYTDHASWWLDIKLLLQTIIVVFRSKGVAEGDHPNNSKGTNQ
jgi:O-antigen biosynthesis protein WbqP